MTEIQYESINKRIDRLEDELKQEISQLRKSLHGNGKEGFGSRLAVLEAKHGGVARFIWMIAGAALSAASTITALSVVGGLG